MAKKILIVDDSMIMRRMVGATLSDAGYEVVEKPNGQEALSALSTGSGVDLIITDLNMPVMDGLTLIKQARGLASHRFTPILVLTTEGRDMFREQGKEAGATGWIVKPFYPEQLLRVVQKVLH